MAWFHGYTLSWCFPPREALSKAQEMSPERHQRQQRQQKGPRQERRAVATAPRHQQSHCEAREQASHVTAGGAPWKEETHDEHSSAGFWIRQNVAVSLVWCVGSGVTDAEQVRQWQWQWQGSNIHIFQISIITEKEREREREIENSLQNVGHPGTWCNDTVANTSLYLQGTVLMTLGTPQFQQTNHECTSHDVEFHDWSCSLRSEWYLSDYDSCIHVCHVV